MAEKTTVRPGKKPVSEMDKAQNSVMLKLNSTLGALAYRLDRIEEQLSPKRAESCADGTREVDEVRAVPRGVSNTVAPNNPRYSVLDAVQRLDELARRYEDFVQVSAKVYAGVTEPQPGEASQRLNADPVHGSCQLTLMLSSLADNLEKSLSELVDIVNRAQL